MSLPMPPRGASFPSKNILLSYNAIHDNTSRAPFCDSRVTRNVVGKTNLVEKFRS